MRELESKFFEMNEVWDVEGYFHDNMVFCIRSAQKVDIKFDVQGSVHVKDALINAHLLDAVTRGNIFYEDIKLVLKTIFHHQENSIYDVTMTIEQARIEDFRIETSCEEKSIGKYMVEFTFPHRIDLKKPFMERNVSVEFKKREDVSKVTGGEGNSITLNTDPLEVWSDRIIMTKEAGISIGESLKSVNKRVVEVVNEEKVAPIVINFNVHVTGDNNQVEVEVEVEGQGETEVNVVSENMKDEEAPEAMVEDVEVDLDLKSKVDVDVDTKKLVDGIIESMKKLTEDAVKDARGKSVADDLLRRLRSMRGMS